MERRPTGGGLKFVAVSLGSIWPLQMATSRISYMIQEAVFIGIGNLKRVQWHVFLLDGWFRWNPRKAAVDALLQRFRFARFDSGSLALCKERQRLQRILVLSSRRTGASHRMSPREMAVRRLCVSLHM